MNEPKYKVGQRVGFFTISTHEPDGSGVIIDIIKNYREGKFSIILQPDKIVLETSDLFELES